MRRDISRMGRQYISHHTNETEHGMSAILLVSLEYNRLGFLTILQDADRPQLRHLHDCKARVLVRTTLGMQSPNIFYYLPESSLSAAVLAAGDVTSQEILGR
jgi:hypothetical protein